ncbi:LysR family transcriptional regulator [Pseudodonghicola xiamenensis]|uniref:Transcriptional regulator n=1 Tax=Pseudodonghicola xiamenensis TaxID=337702 RepID=A0A8J3MG88_9RHOB|nr:LysR family transcriptional regulator [Pseudodonghicola xiamenensis]GHG99435.1 transcriptional regulator [Pseudodonghicola xiamenensis]
MILQRRYLPDMRMLLTFECAARHGNFTRAGEELALTQSAVSRQIRDLEAQIGKQLFERVRGRVITTQAGRAFLSEVESLLDMANSTMRHATAGGQEQRVLAVNAPPTFAARWLVPRLPDFLRTKPDTRFDITTRRDIFDFATTQCDLAIHFGQPIWPGAICTYLCSELVVPVAGGALLNTDIRDAKDLADAPKIHQTERPHLWADWFTRCELELSAPNEGHWFEQFSLTIEAVKSGMGFGLLPRYLIESELAKGELQIPLDLPLSTDKAYYIATPEGRGDAARDFRDWMIGAVSFRPLA